MMKTSKPLPSAIARHFSPTPPKFTHRLLTSTAGAQSTIRDWYAVQRNTRFHHQRGYATIVNDQPMNTGSSRFPFPPHPNPTAHEIFHLTSGASQGDIKKRYYELVRYHHPDSHHCRRLSQAKAQSQFQSITAAYDYLRGVSTSHLPNAKRYGYTPGQSNFDPYLHELARRRRAQRASQEQRGYGPRDAGREEEFNSSGQKELTILAMGVVALLVGLYPSFVLFPFHLERTHRSAVQNLSQARSDALDMGDERRAAIRERVQSMQQRKGSGPHSDSEVDSPSLPK